MLGFYGGLPAASVLNDKGALMLKKPCFRSKTALAARLRLFFAFRLIEIGLAQPIMGVITAGLNAA